jgi:hypothetical protein
MRYTEQDVAKLISQVEKAFTSKLVSAEMSLAKSEDGEKKPFEGKEEHEEKPEHKEESAEHEEGHKPEGHEGEEHEAEGEHAPEGHEAPGDEGHDYDEEDMNHMHKMYASMSDGERKAHHETLSKCMGNSAAPAEMGKAEITSSEPGKTPGAKSPASKAEGNQMKKSDGSGGEMSGSTPKDTPGAKSPASKAEGNQMAKTETGKIESSQPGKTPGAKSEASKAEGMQMEKSENQEVSLLKSELAAEKAEKVAIKEFLTAFVKKAAPQGKAITSLDVIAKSEAPAEDLTLTKGQIHEILKSKTADPSLKKSDRDAVTSYYLNGQFNVNSISHLLK